MEGERAVHEPMPAALVDLFCGMGGASCGAALAGVPVLLAVDANEEALRTHAANHPNCQHQLADLPCELDLPRGPYSLHVHASPPCQKFSSVNVRNVTEKDQAESLSLIEWSVRFAREHATTWSLEQVSSPHVRSLLTSLGVPFVVVDAADFGVPQHRKRIVAGSDCVVEGMRDKAEKFRQSGRPYATPATSLPHCEGTHLRNGNTNAYLRGADGTHKLTRITISCSRFHRPVTEPAYTVTASSPVRWWSEEWGGCKSVSVSDLALLQSFPPTYLIHPVKRHANREVGNALPPLVAKAILDCALPQHER